MKLKDMQHERLIHLLVTMTVAICFVLTTELAIVSKNMLLAIVGLGLAGLLVPYIWHYFKLENQVQKKERLPRRSKSSSQ